MALLKPFGIEKKDEQNLLSALDDVERGKDTVDFGSAEHDYVGDKVKLPNGLKYLKLPNGVELTLGQIIALAGDFYGIPEHPIIDPSKEVNQVDSERNRRFSEAYNSLARAPKDELQVELNEILSTLSKGRQTGTSIKAKTWDQITGGKWLSGLPVKPGRMLKLAETNHDHFLPYAKEAYLTGHQLAMDKAREASTSDSTEWEKLVHEALSLDAFACHFLTDSFASGHIR